MKELESVTEETLVDPKELNQLIARLSNPTPGRANGGVSVKDVAETMDISEADVIRELERLRESKRSQPVDQHAEKLAGALTSLQSHQFQPITNRPLKRVIAMSVLSVAVVIGMFMIIAFSLSQQTNKLPPVRNTNTIISSPP